MIFNFSRHDHTKTSIARCMKQNTQTQTRSGVSLFLYDDTDGMEALLTEDLVSHVVMPSEHNDYMERTITVPKDAFTDFASCPRLLWNIFAPIGKHTKAAIVHDYLYTTGRYSRQQADYAFRELMRECKVGFTKRWLMWAAVRLFGGCHHKGTPKCSKCTRIHGELVWTKGKRQVEVYVDDLGVCQICRHEEIK